MDREKKARVAILISDKIYYKTMAIKTRAIKRGPGGRFIILKGRINQEGISIINTYALNIAAPKCIREM